MDRKNKHRGKVLKFVIQHSGYKISQIASKLGISRNTLYNRFKQQNVNYDFIINVGEIIHYNFDYDFPEISSNISYSRQVVPVHIEQANKIEEITSHDIENKKRIMVLEKKIARLQSTYDELLFFLKQISNDTDHIEIKEDIEQILVKDQRAFSP